jgi:non-lysosomal glucosylceramidase
MRLITTGMLALSAAFAARAPPPSLYDSLAASPFLHSGVVHATDTFVYIDKPCSYLEPENVTVAPAAGIGWTQGPACPLLHACAGAGGCAPGPCAPGPARAGFDRPGGDYRAYQLPAPSPAGAACAAACCGEAACAAWAYAEQAPAGQEPSCAAGAPCCYLKASARAEVPTPGVTSGTVSRGAAPNATAPPMGLRSAAPLGGLGAGALELRADGTVHEVTIQNQSPAGAAKFGVLEDLMLGARVGGVARALRTSPPAYAAGAGASALAYAALYPLASLAFADAAADFAPAAVASVGVFAYSTLAPGDPAASAAPAVAFTLAVANAGDAPLEASLFLSLPLASVNDCARKSALPPVATLAGAAGPAACLAACAAAAGCASWTLAADATCVLAADAPLSVHAPGAFCGLRGAFSADGAALTLALPCPAAAPGPACGDATLRPAAAGGAAPSLGAAADAGALWRAFAATGGFAPGGGVSAGSFAGAAVGHGAASATLTVPPRSNATLSIVLAWHFPHRDHAGEDIGNFYATLFSDSADVARALAAPGALERAAADLSAHHAVFAGGGSSLPDWLADFAVNAMSHFRGMIFSRDGRMREFEAFDCMDLDSIHNDYQRHLPYLWLFPQFEVQKLRKWATGQDATGFIPEFLGPFGVGPFDVPGGRIMGDTTTLWVVELFEVWRETADDALLAELWPVAARALGWLAANAQPLGLPEKLYSTYDILWLDSYNTTAYNSFLYMAALRAGGALAARVGDAGAASAAAAALARAQDATEALLWNSTSGFFRAYSYNNDSAVMADSLYGAMIAAHLGLGFLAPPAQLAAHLRAEVTHNYDPAGFVSITGRATPPPGGQRPDDGKLWQQAGPDWSTMALQLGPAAGPAADAAAALDPARRQLENWRSRLHHLWNLAGLTSATVPGDDSLSALPCAC